MVIPEEIEYLILDQLADELTSNGAAQLKDWIEADEQHKTLYLQYCSVWYGGAIGYRKREQGKGEWNIILQKHQRRRQRFIIRRAASIAACFILIIGAYWLFSPTQMSLEEVQTISVAELIKNRKTENVRLILSTGREIILDKEITEKESGASLQSDSTGLKYSSSNNNSSDEITYNQLVVPKCGEYRLILADGTKIMVNSESVVRYPVNFSGSKREIWLEGEAYFEVARNESQPFIVHLAESDVKVLGTSFNVLAYKDESNTEVTLVEGKVEVKTSGDNEILLPGYQVQIDHITSRMENKKVDVALYTAWKEGVMRFDDLPLERLMLRLSRWYNIVFEFSQEELKGRLFSGGFKKYEELERVLNMIQKINDVKFSVVNDKIVISKK